MIKAVISGSYHKDNEGLAVLFKELETCGVQVLSPLSVEFLDSTEPVVKSVHESALDISALEQFHLRAIREADVLFVHAPHGYVGISTSFEIGYAVSRHVPVVSLITPLDEMLQTVITEGTHVFDVLSKLGLIK
ncbi:hypothetical protein KC973_03325 [Candidatus Saccharibacteria bacterium]|nr:hypothetical protein [Candidatus Saccharibacteria bacterium]